MPTGKQMDKIKVLNLYAGIGGNRKLWENVEVTAIENVPEIAKIYQDFFPNDNVMIADAHQYLLEHYHEFDFIWSSPPCPTHSQFRYRLQVLAWGNKPVYPDMTLYEEIIFLQYYFKGKWVVENVESYYEPLIKPVFLERHYFWTNFFLDNKRFERNNVLRVTKEVLMDDYGFDLSKYDGVDKRQLLRNCVKPELGSYIFNEGIKQKQKTIGETWIGS